MSNKVAQRHDRILDALAYRSVSSVNALAKEMDVSVETIRKDLMVLMQKDLVIRIHGGVGLANEKAGRKPRDVRKIENIELKRAIAQKAVQLVKPDATIIIENSTTTCEMAQALLNAPELLSTLTIITNSFPICMLYEFGALCKRLFFLGGLCSHTEQSTCGHYASKMMKSFHAQQSFISGAGISNSLSLMGYLEDDVVFQTQAIECADEPVLLVDSTKFQTDAWLTVSPLSAFTHIVTDLNREHPIAKRMLHTQFPIVFS